MCKAALHNYPGSINRRPDTSPTTPFGLFQLAGSDATHSASTVIAKGAFFGVFMTLFQLTMGRNLTERRSERKAEANLRSN